MNPIRKSHKKNLKTEYLNKSKTAGHQAIGYFGFSGLSLYYFIVHSPPEYLSCIFPTASAISLIAGHTGIKIMNEYYDKAKSLQKEIDNKTFLTNNTKTTPESTHK